MSYFDQEAYLKLEALVKQQASAGNEDALEDLGFLKRAVLSFANYVYVVVEEQIETKFAKGVKKGDELRDTISHFDETRHNAHETAIVSAKMINRIAAAYKVGAVFTGDQSNRREIGHFCGEITSWVFENRYK